MRTCPSCGKENPADQDFCSCGEYLRWEPTGIVQAITPEMVAQAQAEAAPPKAPAEPQVEPAAPPPSAPPEAGNGHAASAPAPSRSTAPVKAAPPPPAPPIPSIPKTMVQGAVPKPPAAAEAPERATIVLRLPDGDPAKGETLHQGVEPGQRSNVLAMVRNQSGIVDNYDLRIEGLPDDWWSIYPGTVYLVPFGSGGTYEQEVEVHLHPPKGPEAEARQWDLKVIAHSKAHGVEAASAPLALHIAPYIETATTLRPQRKKGRRKADFDISVVNKANAPVLVALEGMDPDDELKFGFNRPPQEIPPGGSVKSTMRVRPPKQIWIGRPREHRLEVITVTGEEAAARAAAEPLGAEVLAQDGGYKRKGLFRRRVPQVPGVYGPRMFKPQIYPPDMQIGPGGINLRKPQFRGPQLQGPQLQSLNASQLAKGGVKMPGRGGAATPQAALMPTQGVFRQKSWLPWWLVPVLLLIALLLLLLYKLFPQDVAVPNVVGQKSAFEAEKKLTTADLKLDPNQKQKTDDKAAPGSVIGQTPAPGDKVKKNAPVAILVAVGSGKVNVPNIVGQTAGDAEKSLRGKNLTLGQASPQPVDPKGKISSQIPAAGEVVKAGTPVNIFYPDPADAANKKKKGDEKKGGAGAGAAAGAGAGAGGGAKDIVVPAIAGQDVKAYAKKAADLGIVPQVKKAFNDAKVGTLFATVPPGGTKVANGAKETLLQSAGQPDVIYANGNDILRANGATGAKFAPVASSPQEEASPTWSADGTHVAYTADGRVFLKDLSKKDAPAIPLSKEGDVFSNLAWAPKADENILAMSQTIGNPSDVNSDLCFGVITKDPLKVSCLDEPGFSVERAIHWSTDGRTILGVGFKNPIGSGIFGIVRWKVKKDKPAFSSNPDDWSRGHFVTDISTPNKGVLDAVMSPDGEQLALIANQGSSFFRLWLAKKGDFLLTSAKPTPVRACKVTWRGDGLSLLVIQSDSLCQQETGALARVDAKDPRTSKTLSPTANDPQFRPFNLGG